MARTRVLSLALFLFLPAPSFGQAVPASSSASPESQTKQPVYILLFSSLRDHLNVDLTDEPLQRTLPLLKRLHDEFPQYGVSCLYQFSGGVSENLAARNGANGLADRVRESAQLRIIEVGYDGAEEPTFVTRPRPNLRNARTPEQRWLARAQATEWFLTEHKDFFTGEPDPDKSGGLKRTQEVFGEVASAVGITLELGGDSEVVNQLRQYNQKAIMPGLPEPQSFPARNLHGYRGSTVTFGSLMSPAEDSAPEVFWQDNVLRVSDTSGPPVKVVYAHEGPAALKAVLDNLDRSRIHVIKVQLGHHGLYTQAGFANGRYSSPLDYVYDNPKAGRVPDEFRRSRQEMDEAFGREAATLKWLVEEFFPSNRGSRFVSATALRQMAATSVGTDVSRERLTEAARNLLREWETMGNNPPPFVRAGDEYFSLADMFQMLASALARLHQDGVLPASVRLTQLYGPIDMPEELATTAAPGNVTVGSVARECADIAPQLNANVWKPLPLNMVPPGLTIDSVRVNAAQFLRLMAEAFLSPNPSDTLQIRTSQMFSPAGEMFPRSRPRSETGATWTLKPAKLCHPSQP